MADELNNEILRLETVSKKGMSLNARRLHKELIRDLKREHVIASTSYFLLIAA